MKKISKKEFWIQIKEYNFECKAKYNNGRGHIYCNECPYHFANTYIQCSIKKNNLTLTERQRCFKIGYKKYLFERGII